jgi:hypothetical protein
MKLRLFAGDAFLISSPDTTARCPPPSRTRSVAVAARRGEPPLACFKGKTAALFALAGALGGLRPRFTRAILGNIGALLADQLAS